MHHTVSTNYTTYTTDSHYTLLHPTAYLTIFPTHAFDPTFVLHQ